MWAKAYRKFPHSNQDTNNAIESYHGFIKRRYIYEENNAHNRRVDWLIYVLLMKVELHYIHNQRLKEVEVTRPKKSKKQLILSRYRATQIPDEDCMHYKNKTDHFLVRSQNEGTHDTWYHVIYTGSEFNFCTCDWALNGNVCKHILKVEMLVSKDGEGIEVLPNASNPILESPRPLVDLNDNIPFNPLLELQKQKPSEDIMFLPCFDSSKELENLSDPIHLATAGLDHLVSEDNELEILMLENKQYGRAILDNPGTILEQARALNNGLKNLFNNLDQEFKTKFINTVSPSKINTKRQHIFLSPIRKKKICSGESHSTKDMRQFQRVGRARAKKKIGISI